MEKLFIVDIDTKLLAFPGTDLTCLCECDVFFPMNSSLRCTQLDNFILFHLPPVIISVELSKVAIKFQLDL